MSTAPPRTVLVRATHGAARPATSGTRRAGSSRRPPPRKSTNRRRPAPKRRSRRSLRSTVGRWWPALLVVVVALVGIGWAARGDEPAPRTSCTVEGTSVELTGEQAANVEAIAAVARERDLPARAVVIALATAQQESRLRNVAYGDRDSLGLFQQRPSQGWGTPEQVQDPAYAAGEFYERLVQVPRWDTRPLGEASHAVQRSAFPERVPRWEPMAAALTAALDEDGDLPLSCPPAQ